MPINPAEVQWDDEPAPARQPNRTFYNPQAVPESLDIGSLYGTFRQQFPSARVTSTRRTPEENARLPNAAPNSFHLSGEAWDAVPSSSDEERALVEWGTRNGLQVKVERQPYHVHFEPPARGIATSAIGAEPAAIDAASIKWDPEAPSDALELDIVGGTAATPEQVATDQKVVEEAKADPLWGMSRLDRFLAGAGKATSDTLRGLRQAATEGISRNVAGAQNVLEAGGLDASALDAIRDPLMQYVARQRNEAAERERLDAPLMGDGYGFGGAMAGTAAQFVGPGLLARGSAAAPLIMPSTLRGVTAQGAAVGYLQPATDDIGRAENAGLGAAAGAAGGVIPRIVGGGVRAVRANPITASGAQRRAVEVIQREAASPEALMRSQPSQVPGVSRSLFEETLDPGVARLETKSRGVTPAWVARDKANNAARVGAIRQFAGDEQALKQAIGDRGKATKSLRDLALQDRGVDVAPVRSKLAALVEQSATRPSRQAALLDVQKSLDAADDSVASLYGTRQYIDDLMAGKAGADKGYAKAAKADLVQIKQVLDEEIRKASPSFGNYLSEFIERSKPIDRMKVGQQLLRQGSGSQLDPDTGMYMLMPGQFGNAVKNLDTLTERATKFRGNIADRVLRPQDLGTIRAVQDDLARQSQRLTSGTGGGSQTDALAEVGGRIAGRSLARFVPGLSGAMEFLDSVGARRLEGALAEVLQNPQQYRAIAARLPSQDRRLLEEALSRAGAITAIGAATAE